MDKKLEEVITALGKVPKLDCRFCPAHNHPELCYSHANSQFCTLAIQTILKTVEIVYKDVVFS